MCLFKTALDSAISELDLGQQLLSLEELDVSCEPFFSLLEHFFLFRILMPLNRVCTIAGSYWATKLRWIENFHGHWYEL